MPKSRWRWLGYAIGVVLFAGAVYVVYAELRAHPWHELVAELRSLPRVRIWLALGVTVLGYLALSGYDLLSLVQLGHRLPYHCVAFAAFLGYAFANSLPLSVVTGASVRYRLYSAWGLSSKEAGRVITLNTVTYVVGLLAAAGVAFVIQPVMVPGFLRLPLHSARPVGAVCLALVAAYVAWSAKGGRPLRLFRWELPRPTPKLAAAQIIVSCLDWALSGAALYVLLPHRLPFHVFFAVFLLGQIAALVAQVPAGLGVFEAVMLWGTSPAVPTAAMVVGLVGYRVVYFLLPLVIAATIWAVREGREWAKRRHARRRPVRARAA
jgi:uncharacterized membrane protein YbhN (UPF0104 family)